MAKLISKTYGDALFELALEKDMVDTLFEEAKAILGILDAEPDFKKLMTHPKILKEEKIGVLEESFKSRVSDEMTGFLTIIVKKDRFAEVVEILSYFVASVKEYKHIGIATVATPVAMTTEQKKATEARLLELTNYETMEIAYTEDESLIGGMVIRIGDRVVDSSISTKIKECKRELLAVQI